MRFNLVLVPASDKVNNALIQLASETSSHSELKTHYLLKDIDKLSIPHVSVIQFELKNEDGNKSTMDEKRSLELIWEHALFVWQELTSFNPELLCSLSPNINYKHDLTGLFKGMSWAELLINKVENPWIQIFHSKLHEKFKELGIACLNASGNSFTPHFTLFNVYTKSFEHTNIVNMIPEHYATTLKSFSLIPALGRANNNWELIDVFYKKKSSNKNLLLENSLWKNFERAEKIGYLRKLLELDTLPCISDEQTKKMITKQFISTANNQKQDYPLLIAIGGGPGAGKSYFYDYLNISGKIPENSVVHDPDLVMQSIPQYQEDAKENPVNAFKKWELPARHLANEILLKALMERYHIVYLRTFALSDSLNFVRASKMFGYRSNISIIRCNLTIALDRAKKREIKTKRHIPAGTLINRHEAVLKIIPNIIDIADNYFIYENNKNGSPPLLKDHSSLSRQKFSL